MNTADVATLTGYSVQQIRDLERLGVIPCALRKANHYREFTNVHVHSLRTYRDLASAVGPFAARQAMREIQSLPLDATASLVCSFHTRLNFDREQALVARAALEAIRSEAATDVAPLEADSMTITELSHALGVKASTLRFWEKVGLVAPERISARTGSVRRYHLIAIREARITTALRAGGYRIPDVQAAITAVRELHDVSHAVRALDKRLDVVATRSLARSYELEPRSLKSSSQPTSERRMRVARPGAISARSEPRSHTGAADSDKRSSGLSEWTSHATAGRVI